MAQKNLTKLAQHLQSFEEKRKAEQIQNQHAVEIAKLNAKADAEEAAGFLGRKHESIRKAMFAEIVKKFGPELVEWVEPYFVRGEVTIEEYTDYSAPRDPVTNELPVVPRACMSFGWRGSVFQFIGRAKSFHPNWRLVEESTGTSTWRTQRNGKVRIYTGDFGNQSQYKQLKDGTHRYADIANDFWRQWSVLVEIARIAKAKNALKYAVEEVLSQTGPIKDYRGIEVTASADSEKPIQIRLGGRGYQDDRSVVRTMTVNKAVALIEALKDAGFND